MEVVWRIWRLTEDGDEKDDKLLGLVQEEPQSILRRLRERERESESQGDRQTRGWGKIEQERILYV